MPDLIVLDLHLRFPGLLPPCAVTEPMSVEDAAEWVDRFLNFSHVLCSRLEDEYDQTVVDSMDAKLICSDLAPTPLSLSQLLSIGQWHISEGVADHYLCFMSQIIGADYIHAERSSGALSTVASAWQGMTGVPSSPRPVVLGTVVSDLPGSYLCNGDSDLLEDFASRLHAVLGPRDYWSVWLVRGSVMPVNHRGTPPFRNGTSWVSLDMKKSTDLIIGRVSQILKPKPRTLGDSCSTRALQHRMCCIAFAERAMQGSISSLHRQKRISVG